MPLEAGTELRAQEGRPRAVSEARGKVIDGALAEPRAPEITIIVPEGGGVAVMDGTPTTDAAIERKLVAAVRRHPTVKVKLSYAEKARTRAQAVEALVRKAGAKDVEVTAGIVRP